MKLTTHAGTVFLSNDQRASGDLEFSDGRRVTFREAEVSVYGDRLSLNLNDEQNVTFHVPEDVELTSYVTAGLRRRVEIAAGKAFASLPASKRQQFRALSRLAHREDVEVERAVAEAHRDGVRRALAEFTEGGPGDHVRERLQRELREINDRLSHYEALIENADPDTPRHGVTSRVIG